MMPDRPEPLVPSATADIPLMDLAPGASARVVSVAGADSKAPADVGRRLAELGFLPAEAERIVARGLLARAPITARIGTATLARRVFDDACLRARPAHTLIPYIR